MTDVIELDDGIFVAGQIGPGDEPALRARGIATIINNRPDGEEAGQPTAGECRAAFEAAGFSYEHVPVTMQTLSPEVVDAFQQARRHAKGPVLAHCRSGMRSALLWALAEARYGERSAAEILGKAREAGFDLSSASGLLEQVASLPR